MSDLHGVEKQSPEHHEDPAIKTNMTNMNDETVDTYPLDDATVELMNETLVQWNAIKAFREGVLALFIRQHKLPMGHWELAKNGKELVRAPLVQPPKQPEPPSDLEKQLAASIEAQRKTYELSD